MTKIDDYRGLLKTKELQVVNVIRAYKHSKNDKNVPDEISKVYEQELNQQAAGYHYYMHQKKFFRKVAGKYIL